jgi:hypothetical protein
MNLLHRPAFYEDMAREEIWLLEHAGAEIADRWHESVVGTIAFLDEHPLFGRARRDLDFPGIRSWGVQGFRRWVVFYGVRGDDLILFRVISGTINLYVLGFD